MSDGLDRPPFRSLDDIGEPSEGVRFWSWGTTSRVVMVFLREFGPCVVSTKGLLETMVRVGGQEYILAPGSIRFLHALKAFAPLKGKSLEIVVTGTGFERQFHVSRVDVRSDPPSPARGPRHALKPGEQTLP